MINITHHKSEFDLVRNVYILIYLVYYSYGILGPVEIPAPS